MTQKTTQHSAQNDAHYNKQQIERFNQALYNYDSEIVKPLIEELFDESAVIQLAHPLETLANREALFTEAFEPLQQAIPDLERRAFIMIAGNSGNSFGKYNVDGNSVDDSDNISDNSNWVGCAGYYTGTFIQSWLDIPPTGHLITMRFHEFYRFKNGKIVEMQALWDIPEVMHQAGAWPMVPSLGREGICAAPATLDGNHAGLDYPFEQGRRSQQLVLDMLDGLGDFATGGVNAMQLNKYWHPRCNWYGPSGIGACRGIAGFRNWHQIPFLNALPNRTTIEENGHLFAEGDYVAFTAWPGMAMMVSGDGWLGIAPAGQSITLRSLDFWRCEEGLIRENWVLVDILHAYKQVGIDVLARMREFNKARYRQFDK